MSHFTECVIDQVALGWLEGLGYDVLSGPEIAPDRPGAERADYIQVDLPMLALLGMLALL